MANYKKILRTGVLMSALVLTGGLVVPAAAETRVTQDTSTDRDDDRGFDNWGLLGLLGLAGLMGRKRERDVAHPGNVPHSGRV